MDRIVLEAYKKPIDAVTGILAKCLVERKPPQLIGEVSGLVKKRDLISPDKYFRDKCRDRLPALADKHGLRLGQFLICGPKPIEFEERGSSFSREEASLLKDEEKEELIKIFRKNDSEPVSIVDIEGSVIKSLSNEVHAIQRLYLADHNLPKKRLVEIRAEVSTWKNPAK